MSFLALLLIQMLSMLTLGAWVAFESTFLNGIFSFLMSLSIPITAWIVLDLTKWSWVRIAGRLLIGLSMPLYVLAAAAPAVRHHTWTQVSEISVDGSLYRAYRRNYYIYDHAIELRKETPIVPGLHIASGPSPFAYADRATFRVKSDGTVQAKVFNYAGSEPWIYTFPKA